MENTAASEHNETQETSTPPLEKIQKSTSTSNVLNIPRHNNAGDITGDNASSGKSVEDEADGRNGGGGPIDDHAEAVERDGKYKLDAFVKNILTRWKLEKYIPNFEKEQIDKDNFLLVDTDTISQLLISEAGPRCMFLHNRQKLIQARRNAEAAIQPATTDNKRNGQKLRTLLEQSREGRALLLEKSLPTTAYKLICRVILPELEKKKPSYEDYMMWREEIVGLFRGEDPTRWYQKENGKPSGKLYHKYTNAGKGCSKAAKTYDLCRGDVEREKMIESEEPFTVQLQNCPLDDEKQLLRLWRKTFESRSSENDTQEYFEQYPALKAPFGLKMLMIDYKLMCKKNNLTDYKLTIKTEWPNLCEKIMAIGKKTKSCLQHFEGNDEVSPEILALKVLPYCFRTTTAPTKKKAWRPSLEEQASGFINWVHTAADIDKTVEKHANLQRQHHLDGYPLIFAVGPLTEIGAVYVIINNNTYPCSSILDAVDACFKSFYALGAEYPTPSRAVWTFIQSHIYKIPENMTNFQSVKDVINQIELIVLDD